MESTITRIVRPDWDTYFLDIARSVAQRADCRRARYGCVIVRDNRIVATGYNGGPAGGPSCLKGECPRGLLNSEQLAHNFADYSNCKSIHAEANALLHSNRSDLDGGTLYIAGLDGVSKPPCDGCSKLIMGTGLRRMVWPGGRCAVTPSGIHGLGVVSPDDPKPVVYEFESVG